MTEWMCRYTPVWIHRGDSLQKTYLEEWEKLDVGENMLWEMTIRSSTATATKTEGVLDTQDFKRTSMREARRDDCSLPKSSGEAVGTFDALSWKYSGTQENDVSWGSQGAQRSFHFIHPNNMARFPEGLFYRMILRPG